MLIWTQNFQTTLNELNLDLQDFVVKPKINNCFRLYELGKSTSDYASFVVHKQYHLP